MILLPQTTPFSVSGPHIADVNILLPPKMTHPVEYRLRGSDGCFKWSWDHHDILALLPEYNASSLCSTSARLKSIAPYSGRKETAVYATDMNTGAVIRCKIYIDRISRIKIFHSSVKLDLDGLATLRVRAFDSEENVFSSLVGLQFMWQLMPEKDGLPHHLVHVPLKESPLSDCGGLCGDLDIQVKIEDSGVYSDLYVVRGTEIGHEVVSVHLVEPLSEHMADNIVLTVAEAMSLDPPSPVCVLLDAIVHYSLKVIHGNIPQLVTLPSAFHRWSILNSSVAQVDQMMGTVRALNLGMTAVIVEDTRVAGHTQVSTFLVALPDSLLLYILPLSAAGDLVEGIEPIPSVSRWYIVAGRQYLIHMKVFSQGPGAQEIYITKNDNIELHDTQSEFWSILPIADEIVEKGRSRILKATSYGLGKLIATLKYSSGDDGTKKILKVVQEVMVCDQVKFSMDGVLGRILLPWAPGVHQEMELKATGGCAMLSSDYKWFSSDTAIVSVSASGTVEAKNPGRATIKAVSSFDSLNFDEVVVEVYLPSSMLMLPNFPVETLIGSHLLASVTLKTSNGAFFHKCDAFRSSIKWKCESDAFTIVDAGGSLISDKLGILDLDRSSYGPPCALSFVYAASSGQTMLHATMIKEYQPFDHSISSSVVLKASSRIAAYSPLHVYQASDGNKFGGYWFDMVQTEANNQQNLEYLYLVPGTHVDLILNGGPERWDHGVEFIETVEATGQGNSDFKDGGLVHKIFNMHGSAHRVKCQEVGNYKLTFKRGNLIGNDHPLPAISEVQLLVTCSFPSSIALIADEPVNAIEVIQSVALAERTNERIQTTPVRVANGRTVRMSAVGISDSGKAFANSSSLPLMWELIDCDDLAFWDDLATTQSNWEKFLVLQNATGVCLVRATVVPSSSHVSQHFIEVQNDLTDAITLQLVSSLRLLPEFSLLFFSPDARLNLSITGGSCSLDTLVNDTKVVEIMQPAPGLQCLQLLLAPKKLGTVLVTVRDIGLAPPLSASSMVQVADVDWIKITSGEELILMKGSMQEVNFLAGVSSGFTFDLSQYAYMSIQVHIEDDIVELAANDQFSSNVDGYANMQNFTVHAVHVGVTNLYISARRHSGHEIRSQPIKIEVYAPPRIHPSDIFLVPGASYALTVKGGPTSGAYVKYSCKDVEVAKIHSSSGRVSAVSPGNSTVIATVYTSGDLVICQAYGKVKVGVPSLAMLNVQSEQLAVGRHMPIFPSLSEGNLFSFYELCKNYKWTIEDEGVLGFEAVDYLHGKNHMIPFSTGKEYGSTGYSVDHDNGFIKVLHGRSAGKTNVKISFTCDFLSSKSSLRSRLYNASISMVVVPELPLALGLPATWILPPHYTTSDLLPLSLDSHSKGNSPSLKNSIMYSLLGECDRKVDGVPDDAIFIDEGKIRTTESGNLACIQAKDMSTGRTEVASCLRVAEVAQIRFTGEKLLVHTLAIGGEVDLPIKYYDVLGNPFHEAQGVVQYGVETNYPDVVSIEDSGDSNGKIHLRALGQGRALLQIAFSSNPQKSDYVVIFVGARLHPQNPVLHPGSHLNFRVEGLDDQILGQWFSANESIVSVDLLSGKAEAIREGTTHVIFNSSNVQLQTAVSVLKHGILSVHAPNETLTNVHIPTKGYSFIVKLDGSHSQDIKTAQDTIDILFDCRVDPPYVGYVKPWKDFDTGNSYCLFFPYPPEHSIFSSPESRSMGQEMSVSISASLKGEKHVSSSASALFVGGFSILEVDRDSLRLNMTSGSIRSIITIVGNTNVEMLWHDKDRLSVRPIHRDNSQIGWHARYEVKIHKAEKFRDKLVIKLPSTGQIMEVDVNYDPEEREALGRSAIILRVQVFICIAVFILCGAIVLCHEYHPDRIRQPITPGTPLVAAPITPQRSSPAVVNEESPRTPQPFLDYVRRTIDETPYYRQDVRRRANPQNTF
nr:nuclear pore complex protein GP210 [Ipomoea batatas]GME06981.1 nuclear pore complex protein GP210 [Ipomoea batatas]